MRAAFLTRRLALSGWRRSGWLALSAGVVGLLAGCATPYVVPAGGTRAAPILDAKEAIMDDGFRLPLRAWLPDAAPRALLLAVHGLNDYGRAFDGLGRRLAAAGIAVYAYDQRGFGASRDWGYWHGTDRLVGDLDEMKALLRRRYPDLPLYVLGESMGGAVALAGLGDGAVAPDGIVLVAPAVWSRDAMPFYQRWALAFMAHTFPAERLTGRGLKLQPTDNLEMLRAWARDPLVIKATRVDVLYGVANLMDRATAAAPRLHGPVLLLYGGHDEIVPKTAMCRFLAALPAGDPALNLTLSLYPEGYHMLTRDLDAARVQDDIAGWILDRHGFAPRERMAMCGGAVESPKVAMGPGADNN